MHEARTPGWAERLDLFEAAQASECSKGFQAIPWIDDGDLHVGNTELLVATTLRFGLDLPAQALARSACLVVAVQRGCVSGMNSASRPFLRY